MLTDVIPMWYCCVTDALLMLNRKLRICKLCICKTIYTRKYEQRIRLPFEMKEKLNVVVVVVCRYSILTLVCVSRLMFERE